MEQNKEGFISLRALVVNLKQFIGFLFRKWWIMLIVAVAGVGIGALLFTRQGEKYEAEVTFILEEKSSSGGGLAGLASQFGLNIGSMGGGSIFSGDNILDILKSKTVLQKVLTSPVNKDSVDGRKMADLYLEFSSIRSKWRKKPELDKISFVNIKNGMSELQDSVLNLIIEAVVKRDLLVERVRKQGTIIRVQMKDGNAFFVREVANRIVSEAGKLYLDIRTGTAQENIRQLQRRSDSLLYLLNNKSYTAAAVQPLDINPGIKSAVVPTEIALRDKTVISTIYAEVTKNLEASKMLLSQQTPVIQILDQPGYLLDDHRKSVLFYTVVSAFVACMVYVVISLMLFLLGLIRFRDKVQNPLP